MSNVSFHDLRGGGPVPPGLLARAMPDMQDMRERARPIVEAVRRDGDDALRRFAREYDGVTCGEMSIRATESEFEDAAGKVPPDIRGAIAHAVDNIRRFHEAQKPQPLWMREIEPGAWAGERHLPIDSVACYVPRGKGAFPSVLIMTAVPAVVAGVPRIVVITPPGPDGGVDPGTLVAARAAGVTEVYKCGGAQGVAAVAYGTTTVPKCLKIVGPGSPWVLAAKSLLAQEIDPGIPAGPSESIILADGAANGELAALDLLIEAEHGADSSVFLVTDSVRVAEEVRAALPGHWRRMQPKRRGYAEAVLGGAAGGIVLTRDFSAAVEFVNQFAPEHLEILAAEPMAVLGRIRNAGEVLLGNHTPITLGNYLLGPNAVLPTGGGARTHSPLSVLDFMKRSSVGYVTRSGYAALAGDARRLAEYEGFDAHARAVSALRADLLEPR